MAELGIFHEDHLNVVSGLPIRYYKRDGQTLKQQFNGMHTFTRLGKNPVTFFVDRSSVFPQAIGVLADLCLQNGRINNMDTATAHVAIIDIGGRTTNFLHAYRLRDVPDECDSEDEGYAMWDIAKELRRRLLDRFSGLSLSMLEASNIVEKGTFSYDGSQADVQQDLQDIQMTVVENIVNKANDLWKNMKKVDYIFVAGGGGKKLFAQIQSQIPRAVLVNNSIYANANGYRKLAEYQNTQES